MADEAGDEKDLIDHALVWLRIAGRLCERREGDYPPTDEVMTNLAMATEALVTAGRTSPPPIGFDATPYLQFYAQFFALCADFDDDRENNRMYAWYRMGLYEAGRISDSLKAAGSKGGLEIAEEIRNRTGRPRRNAERNAEVIKAVLAGDLKRWQIRKAFGLTADQLKGIVRQARQDGVLPDPERPRPRRRHKGSKGSE